jgi:hypothetical protein
MAFVEVWRVEPMPMPQTISQLRAITIIRELQRHHPAVTPISCCTRCSGVSRAGGRSNGGGAHLTPGALAKPSGALGFTNGGRRIKAPN